MFRIGEFSKLVRVSSRMLRYYDKCGIFHPAETDRFTGYRLYSARQMPLLSRIVALRDMGFGVEEIEEVLPHLDDAAYMQRVFERKRKQIDDTIAAEQAKLAMLAAAEQHIRSPQKERAEMIYEVELKELPAVQVLALRETIPAYDAEGVLWEKMGKFMAQNGIACGLGYSIYHDDEYQEADVDVEIAVTVERQGQSREGFIYKELAAMPMAATVRFSGPYDNYTPAMEKLAAWVEQNGYEIIGNIRGLALASPNDQSDPEAYLTELQAPVRKA